MGSRRKSIPGGDGCKQRAYWPRPLPHSRRRYQDLVCWLRTANSGSAAARTRAHCRSTKVI